MMVAGAALLLGGCASVEMAQYTVTSFAEIPLKKRLFGHKCGSLQAA